MELLNQKLNSSVDQDEGMKAAVVVEEESEDILGVRPLEYNHLEVYLLWYFMRKFENPSYNYVLMVFFLKSPGH